MAEKEEISKQEAKKEEIGLELEEGKEKIETAPEAKAIFRIEKITTPVLPDFAGKSEIDVTYPLIKPFVDVHVHWSEKEKEVLYEILEPELNEKEKKLLRTIELGLEELISLSFLALKTEDAVIEYLEKNVKVLLNEMNISINKETFLKLMYYIYRNFVGLNEIEPMMRDYYIEDIECNGMNSPIYIVHRKYRNLRTNIVYTDLKGLTSFVEKIAQKCGKYISYASPILDGSLPDGSRANATYTQEISSKGPTFTIRKFTTEPWSPVKLMEFRTVSPELLAYIWMLVEHEANIIVIGGTGSGKTSFLNAVAFFIPPGARVVSIEDTKELMLMHENWLPSVARTGMGIGTMAGHGEVTLFDLLKASFRQRPDYVIVGEIRGNEAYVLFQGMSSIKGDEKVLVLNGEHPKRIKIKDMKNNIKYKALTIDPINGKAKVLPVRKIVIHPKRKELYKIKTKSGREVTLTPNHSLFTYNKGIVPVFAQSLNIKDRIVIPAKIPCGYADIDSINLMEHLPDVRVFAPSYIKRAVKNLGYEECNKLCGVKSITDYYSNFKRSKPSVIKSQKFINLMKKAGINYNPSDLFARFDKKSKHCSINLKLSDEFLRLLGYYISEGGLNLSEPGKIALYSKNRKILEDMRKCIISVCGIKPRERVTYGYGISKELSFSHKVLFEFLKRYCGAGSKNKKIPDFIFGLSKERIGQFLSALYDGDGSFTKNYFGYYTISRELANDLTQLLLVYNVVGRIRSRKRRKNKDYEILFYNKREKTNFLEYVKPLKFKIKFMKETNNQGKDYFVDEIKDIKKINLKNPKPVYDISVPGAESFIGGFGGVLLHNSGHPSYGTMHAEDVETMVRRLETPPISLSPALVESLDAVCVMTQAKFKGKAIRRIREITEIIKVGERLGDIQTNTPFMWDPRSDRFFFKLDSHALKKISIKSGMTYQELLNEFRLRARLLMALLKNKIVNYKEVYDVITSYYKNSKEVLARFGIS